MSQGIYDTLTEIAKRRGFFWPSFEIYGSIGGFVTYGDVGVKLKRNIEALWRDFFVRRQGFFEIEDPIINSSKVFEASGHLSNFKEYATTCSQCGRGFRADHLIEEKTGMEHIEALGGEVIKQLLIEHKVKCPVCGSKLNDPVLVLTMFQTQIGATGGEVAYARPETAQGMFTNFKQGYLINRQRLPFAISQVGKVLRNEISPRRGMHRLREFTIMELELFYDPENPKCPFFEEVKDEPIRLITEGMMEKGIEEPIEVTVGEAVNGKLVLTEWQSYFMGLSKRFISALGVKPENQRFRAHLPKERSHYSAQTFDHEVLTKSWGWIEVSGHANRTDYDLKAHMKGSGVDMTVLRQDGSRFIPHVIEPSYGLDRLFYVTIEANYERKEKRNLFHFPRALVLYDLSVQPLVSKDGIYEKAEEVAKSLLDKGYSLPPLDDSGSIGRRYARVDEIGIPLAITIDYDTLKNGAVTLRDRDTWQQVIVNLQELPSKLKQYFDEEKPLIELGELVKRAEAE